jgi:hypothetical protein
MAFQVKQWEILSSSFYMKVCEQMMASLYRIAPNCNMHDFKLHRQSHSKGSIKSSGRERPKPVIQRKVDTQRSRAILPEVLVDSPNCSPNTCEMDQGGTCGQKRSQRHISRQGSLAQLMASDRAERWRYCQVQHFVIANAVRKSNGAKNIPQT